MADNSYTIEGTIQEVRQSQSGKTLGIKINDTWYTTKKFELSGKTGAYLSGECSNSEFNGKTMHWLNEYTLTQDTAQPPQSQTGGMTIKDRQIIVQSFAKATLNPDMTDDQIRARVEFLWKLTGDMAFWAQME